MEIIFKKNSIIKEADDSIFLESRKCLTELFLQQVQSRPNHIAVTCGSQHLTYDELAKQSLKLALYLQFLGAGSDRIVGIFIDPSVELMIAIWGVLLSGSAYLPISSEYPEERSRYMIENSGARIIIVQEKLKQKLLNLVSGDLQIITLEDVNKVEQVDSVVTLKQIIQPEHLAYVIYTSGTTGRPKGVMIEHKSIANQMEWLNHTFNLNHRSIVLQKTPISFDAAQWEILSLSCGSKVIIGDLGIHKNPDQLIRAIIEHDVNVLQCVPMLLQALVDHDEFKNCTSLTHVFSGGEALTKSLVIDFLRSLPKCNVTNLYGPTECTINTSAFTIRPEKLAFYPEIIPIGAPVDNLKYYVLDHQLNQVETGKIGELYISGIGLARGYLNCSAMTAEKFIFNPFANHYLDHKLYKTGDLAYLHADGTFQYVGRDDSQVKVSGVRIELNEIKAVIDTHDWIKHSAVIVKEDLYTHQNNLIAFIELNPKEAALMDQGNHHKHHQSKITRAQVKLQISGKGCREKSELLQKLVVKLPGKIPTELQEQKVFARKTYRFFEGGAVKKQHLLELLKNRKVNNKLKKLAKLDFVKFGEILRYFGQYLSPERLLPKYAYASPGALYATQIYLELNNMGILESGYYYYHPIDHELILIKAKAAKKGREIKIHFIGKRRAIEPIYKNNIQEVLEIEVGHMIGLFENILPEYGLDIKDCKYQPTIKDHLEVAEEDCYLGTFQITSGKKVKNLQDFVDVYVQAHPGKIVDFKAGQYKYAAGKFDKISDEIILKKHVIAINQEVYSRSSFGISLVSTAHKKWMHYINLGRKLQSLQMNSIFMGFMSSGYSSKTGNDLPSAKRIKEILNQQTNASYFFLGGLVSEEQVNGRDMKEDVVHMKGPAEMLKDDLANYLPDSMMPKQVFILDKMPLSANGKVDFTELKKINVEFVKTEYLAPVTEIERVICDLWKEIFKRDGISVNDDFFELGGNSLLAVSIVNKINKKLNAELPLQVLFEATTIQKLAAKFESKNNHALSRLIPLQNQSNKKPIYCWPGLGGYCMNLHLLAKHLGMDRPFYGIQAYGINQNEEPYQTIKKMAAEDIRLIKQKQPQGPYTLWGYSFGARVAFEAAYQLEQEGCTVDSLLLIAPGSPRINLGNIHANDHQINFNNKFYQAILFSVFMGNINSDELAECLNIAHDEEAFVKYIREKHNNLTNDLICRIIRVVAQTFSFKYSFTELTERRINAPITIFKAQGDDYSFLESYQSFLPATTKIIDLKTDHYNLLRASGINELLTMLKNNYDIASKNIEESTVNTRPPYLFTQSQQLHLTTGEL